MPSIQLAGLVTVFCILPVLTTFGSKIIVFATEKEGGVPCQPAGLGSESLSDIQTLSKRKHLWH